MNDKNKNIEDLESELKNLKKKTSKGNIRFRKKLGNKAKF